MKPNHAEIPADIRQLVNESAHGDTQRLEARLLGALNACGCTSGAVALVVSVVGVGAWLVGKPRPVRLWPEVALAGSGTLLVTAAGKLAGLAFARLWLWFTLWELQRKAAYRAGTVAAQQ